VEREERCARKTKNTYKILVCKHEGTRPRWTREDNIKTDFKETGFQGVVRIEMTRYDVLW
jgi:hypothetical protein